MSIGKTITTYLVDSNPQGIKISFISNRICQCVAIPRAMLKDAGGRPELRFPSLYLFFGDENVAYIGETENPSARIAEHNRKKDFWNEALVFSVKDKSLNKADVKYLEYLAMRQVQKAKVYRLDENLTSPVEPSMMEHQRDTVLEFFQDVRMLSSFLGYRLFDEKQTPSNDADTQALILDIELFDEKKISSNDAIWYCKAGATCAQGIYEGKDFRVLEGSKLRKETAPSFPNTQARHEKLRLEKATEQDDCFILNSDMIFPSPSSASSFCLGSKSNGWTSWKNENGQTLHDLVRAKQ